MSNKSGVAMGLCLGIALSCVFGYIIFYNPTVSQLNVEISNLQRSYDTKASEYNSLQSSYTQKVDEYDNLQSIYSLKVAEYNVLQSSYNLKVAEYNRLGSDYDKLTNDYNQVLQGWEGLSRDVYGFYNELQGYVCTEKAIPRVINVGELAKIASIIEQVSQKAGNFWDGVWNIHKYVRDEVKYAYDLDIPIIITYSFQGDPSESLITSLQTGIRRDYVQTLDYTVEFKQGDCDDQAILEYAMIRYYSKYIYRTEYWLHLALIVFNNGQAHMAVFQPVQNGNICILDPAGQYQTGTRSYIQSEQAPIELNNYNGHWSSYGGIKEIKLYDVDIDTGILTEEFKGTLQQIIDYYSN